MEASLFFPCLVFSGYHGYTTVPAKMAESIINIQPHLYCWSRVSRFKPQRLLQFHPPRVGNVHPHYYWYE